MLKRLLLILILLLILGCASTPQQTIVEKPVVTGEVVIQQPDEEMEKVPVEEPVDEVIEEKEKEPEVTSYETGTIIVEKGTAAWAVREAFPTGREWTEDARLFQVNGFNLIEGKITDKFDRISDAKVYQGYYKVSFISEKKGNRELLDIRVDWDGASDRIVTRFLPSSYAQDFLIKGWNFDSDYVYEKMNEVKQGGAYSIKVLEIESAGVKKKQVEVTSPQITVDNQDVSKSDAYSDIGDDAPIATVETYFQVTYEIDLNSGEIIGFYEKRE